jgi:hypothetical protein
VLAPGKIVAGAGKSDGILVRLHFIHPLRLVTRQTLSRPADEMLDSIEPIYILPTEDTCKLHLLLKHLIVEKSSHPSHLRKTRA